MCKQQPGRGVKRKRPIGQRKSGKNIAHHGRTKEKGRRIRVGRGREAAMKGGKRMVDTWAHVLSKEMKIPAKENALSLFCSRLLLIKIFGPLNVSCMPNPFLLSTPVYASFRCLPSNPCCPSSPPRRPSPTDDKWVPPPRKGGASRPKKVQQHASSSSKKVRKAPLLLPSFF